MKLLLITIMKFLKYIFLIYIYTLSFKYSKSLLTNTENKSNKNIKLITNDCAGFTIQSPVSFDQPIIINGHCHRAQKFILIKSKKVKALNGKYENYGSSNNLPGYYFYKNYLTIYLYCYYHI